MSTTMGIIMAITTSIIMGIAMITVTSISITSISITSTTATGQR